MAEEDGNQWQRRINKGKEVKLTQIDRREMMRLRHSTVTFTQDIRMCLSSGKEKQ